LPQRSEKQHPQEFLLGRGGLRHQRAVPVLPRLVRARAFEVDECGEPLIHLDETERRFRSRRRLFSHRRVADVRLVADLARQIPRGDRVLIRPRLQKHLGQPFDLPLPPGGGGQLLTGELFRVGRFKGRRAAS